MNCTLTREESKNLQRSVLAVPKSSPPPGPHYAHMNQSFMLTSSFVCTQITGACVHFYGQSCSYCTLRLATFALFIKNKDHLSF